MIKILKAVILLTIASVGSLAFAEVDSYLGAASLCRQGEIEYFSCELQGSRKKASLCSADNDSPDRGYVQYRFGTHSKIEYVFPDGLIPPRGKISIVDVSRMPDGLGSHVKFTSGSYSYVVSNALVPGEIYVAKDGKIVFDKICKGNSYIPFDSAARRGLEYGVVNSVDEIDRHGK